VHSNRPSDFDTKNLKTENEAGQVLKKDFANSREKNEIGSTVSIKLYNS
jgi:hypothetical protein